MLKLARATALGIAVLLAGCATEAPVPAGAPEPIAPQPSDAALRPGLQPRYFYGDFDHVDRVPTAPAEVAKGAVGKPVANLAAGSNTGRLWEAQSDTQYGVHFSGLIKLQTGEYQFAVKSNDGVRVVLDQTRILEDPTAHPDRFTPPTRVAIAKPGWYRLTVQYFQRRGGAALELHWQPPGAAALSIVPAEALAHLAGG
jgi:hypothetical protein